MVDGEYFTHSVKVPIHCNKDIEVVYTNESAEVEKVLQMYEGWLEGMEEKFMGLDLEYTNDERYYEQVFVVQLGLRNHVLVFHWSRYAKT